jgi:shikimate kinase
MYKIKPLKSARDDIYKTQAQQKYIMPPPGTMIVVGSTGSGKTTIVGNLLCNNNMLKDYYDEIYVFCLSPCTTLIDNCQQIEKENMFMDEDPQKLREIYEKNKRVVSTHGFKRAKHILFILDDIVQSKKMMNDTILSDIFFGGTHNKCSLWLLTQNYMSVPRRLRMNCHSMILVHGINNTEIDRFTDEWQSCYMDKKKFRKLVEYVLDKPYSFLFLNATNPKKKEMFRCGFDDVIVIGD